MRRKTKKPRPFALVRAHFDVLTIPYYCTFVKDFNITPDQLSKYLRRGGDEKMRYRKKNYIDGHFSRVFPMGSEALNAKVRIEMGFPEKEDKNAFQIEILTDREGNLAVYHFDSSKKDLLKFKKKIEEAIQIYEG